jgi:leader peptidase (prepilin peptidase)/N-methyltransferase
MLEIFSNAMVALFGLIMTPFMAGLVDLFCEEKKVTLKNIYSHRKFVPAMALITPMLLLALFIHLGLTLQFFVYAFLTIILIMDAFADLKAQIIPNGLNFIGFLAGAILIYYTTIQDPMAGVDLLLGMLTGGGTFFLIGLLALVIYRKEGMGMGDIKLMAVLGMFFGLYNTVQIFILSFFIGAIGSIFLMVTKLKKGNEYMAFGPYIVISAIITMFLPHQIMAPYWWKFIDCLSSIFTIG